MGERKPYSTSIDSDLIKEIKLLAVKEDMNANDLIEEAIKLLLEKYNC